MLDSLHEKGVDLYKYFAEPIESHGIPSFPVAIALMFIILGGILFGVSILATPTGTVNVSLSTASGVVDGIPVTLVLDGSDFATKSTLNGTVSFDGVPLNRRGQVRVNHPSFQPVLRDISFETGGATSVEIMLASKAPETRDFLVNVLDQSTGAPVRGASISFQSLSTGLSGTATTQPAGTAVIKLDPSDSIISLSINAENFETTQRSVLVNDTRLTIQLIPATGSLGNGGDQATRGTVVVNVKDNLGNFVSANVQLFANGSSEPLASDNVESGVARFENVAPVGTSVYALVNPSNEAYLSQRTTGQEITAGEDLELTVQVENATSSNSQVVSIKVVSDANAAIAGANVALFSTSTNQLITKGTTDNSGTVSFTLSSSISLDNSYAAVNAPSYLPLISSISSRDSTLQLMPLAAGNNVEFDAEVLDADNQPASGATIELRDASGRLYGISQTAGPDGKATFAGIPVDASLRLFALLDGAAGQSDVFQVAFSQNGQRTVSFNLQRPVGTMLVTALNLIDAKPVAGALVVAFADSLAGSAVANCTTAADGTCNLENAWANKQLLLVTSANGFEPSTSASQSVSPGQTKHVYVYILDSQFKAQTVVNLVSLLDDKGNEVIGFPTIEKGRVYTARFAASFANGSQSQGVFVRVGDAATTTSDATVIKSFSYSPSTLGTPLAVHSTTYSPGADCSTDSLNNDVNNEGKKWVEVNYNGVSGVVELTLRVFVKPTADASSDKLNFHYRAFAVQNGKYSRNPYDNELGLERKNQGKDECYADTIDKSFSLIEGSSVCNSQGTACISVSFNSPEQPQSVGSPFIATINRPFNLNFEIRNFGPIEGSSSYAKVISPSGLVKFLQYSGQGTSSIDDTHTSVRTLFAEAADVYNGSISSQGVIPSDFANFKVEFGDSRGIIATNSRAFAVVQGTGALTLTQLTPNQFEVGKSKDLRLTVKTSAGQPITDATIAFQEENGAAFDGDVPAQVAGDNTPTNGLDGQYVVKRIRPVSAGTFSITVSRDRFAPVSQTLTSSVSSFFEFDQPDFISLSCNATTLRVKNTLDVSVIADVFVDPACVNVAGPGVTQVAADGGQAGSTHYRIPDFKPGRTRLLSLSPNSNQSCQVEVSATDPRTGTRSLDNPIQVENTCTAYGSTNVTNADGIVYINGNVFQPPRLMVDTFSQMFYGSYQPTNLYDQRFPDAVSYQSAPLGGMNNFYQRAGVIGSNGQPNQQFLDPRYNGGLGGGVGGNGIIPQAGQFPQQAAGVPRQVAAGGQYGLSGYADQYGGGAAFDIRRQNFQRNWTITWVNQDPVPHSFKCTDRSGNAVVQVDNLAPQSVYSQIINKPGLYKCKLENTNSGTIKIKSMCPKKGAVYYSRLITRCMARKAIGDSGLLDGGKQHAAKIAAAVKTKFIAFAGKLNVEQTDKNAKVECVPNEAGAQCTVKITPLVPRNGFGFAIQDATGSPDYTIRLKPGSTIHESCFTYDQLDKIQSYRALLDPVISGVSAIGLTSAPAFASFAIKFNEKDNCVKIRPDTAKNFRPYISNPATNQFLDGDGYAEFVLQSNANPNVKYTIKLVISPTQNPEDFLDGRYLFTTIPTTVDPNNLFYRTGTSADPREPGFVINNLPENQVGLLPADKSGSPVVIQPNSIGVLSGNEVPDKLASISQLKDGFYLCTDKGGCEPQGGQAKLLTPFIVKPDKPTDNTADAANGLGKTAMQLGDVIGNYKFEKAPSKVSDADKPFICSGTNYCSRATEAAAVDLAQKQVEEAFKKQYQYVETFNLDSTMDNMQDALTDCMASALAEVAAQEAQFQMCKTLADFCGNPNYIDPEEEEVEEGESFASGLTLDGVLGDSKTIIKDVMCQETEAGQNLQALRPCLQPGNRQCRDMIAKRIVGNLRQAKVQSVAKEVPVVSIKDPVINFVTKRIQDDPKLVESDLGSNIALGGYNVYQFAADREKLVGEAGRQTREEGKVIFELRPPGYDFSKAVVTAGSGISGAAFASFRLPGLVYDWATTTEQHADTDKIKQITLGFPYVVSQGTGTNTQTRVEFDQFQPTLLTLNKYPVMRAVINKARETKTEQTNADVDTGSVCTVKNRPVDPLGLFDDCEEWRSKAKQTEYDKKETATKAPFSRSLVFQAVPQGENKDDLHPIWPADYNEATFQVAIPPEYEFTSSGATTAGVSAPAVASIPGLGRALYPLKDVPGQFTSLEIKGDVKKYAVQVTGCKYTRQTDGVIVIADTVENNCNSSQWPIGILFPGSTRDSLSMNINGAEVKCEKGQACIAGQLIGSHLKVAVVDGLAGSTPASSLKTTSDTVELNTVARDLMRYYVDESYTPTSLLEVLKTSNGNNCELKATPVSTLLKCGGATAKTNAAPVPVPNTPAAPAKDYNLVFHFEDAISKDLEAKINAAAGDPSALTSIRGALVSAVASSNTKMTCLKKIGQIVVDFLIEPYSMKVETDGTVKVTPVAPTTTSFEFDAPVISCTATFEINDVAKLRSTATIAGDTITFDFTNAIVPPAGAGGLQSAGPAAGSTCAAVAKLFYIDIDNFLEYEVTVSPPTGVAFGNLQNAIVTTAPWYNDPIPTDTTTGGGSIRFALRHPTQEFILSPQAIPFTIKNATGDICTGAVTPVPLIAVGSLKIVKGTQDRQGFQFTLPVLPVDTEKVVWFDSTTVKEAVIERQASNLTDSTHIGYYFSDKTLRLDNKLAMLLKGETVTARLNTGLTVASQAPASGGSVCQVTSPSQAKPGSFVLQKRASLMLTFPVELNTAGKSIPAGATAELSNDPTKVSFEEGKPIFFPSIAPEDESKHVIINSSGTEICRGVLTRQDPIPPCSATKAAGVGSLTFNGQGNTGLEAIIAGPAFTKTSATSNLEASHHLFVPGHPIYDIEFKPERQPTADEYLRRVVIPGTWKVNGLISRPAKAYLIEKTGQQEPYAKVICEYSTTQTAAPSQQQAASLTGTCVGSAKIVRDTGSIAPVLAVHVEAQGAQKLPADATISFSQLASRVYSVNALDSSSARAAAQDKQALDLTYTFPGEPTISGNRLNAVVKNSDATDFCTFSLIVPQISTCTSHLDKFRQTGPNAVRVLNYNSRITNNIFISRASPINNIATISRDAASGNYITNLQDLPTTTGYLLKPALVGENPEIDCAYPVSTSTTSSQPMNQAGSNLQGQCSAIAEPVYYPADQVVRTKVIVSTPRGSPVLPSGGRIWVGRQNEARLIEQSITADLDHDYAIVPFETFPEGSQVAVSVLKPDLTNAFCTLQPVTVSTIPQCSTSLSVLAGVGLKVEGTRASDLVGKKLFVPGNPNPLSIVDSNGDTIIHVSQMQGDKKLYLLDDYNDADRTYPIRCFYPPLSGAASSQVSPISAFNGQCTATGQFFLTTPTSTSLTLVADLFPPRGTTFPSGYTAHINTNAGTPVYTTSTSARVTSNAFSPSTTSTIEVMAFDGIHPICGAVINLDNPPCGFTYGSDGGFLGVSWLGGYQTITTLNSNLNNLKLFTGRRLYTLTALRPNRPNVWKVEGLSELPAGASKSFMQTAPQGSGGVYRLACIDS